MKIETLHRSEDHEFSKPAVEELELVAGLGVRGDAHCGAQVQHRSRVAVDPGQPNLRQVHLIPAELFTDLLAAGHQVDPGALGENITTRGIDLLMLPVGATLTIGDDAIVAITGLRNPCGQIESYRRGLLAEVLDLDEDGTIVRRAGVMSVVIRGGIVRPGDTVAVGLPAEPHHRLETV